MARKIQTPALKPCPVRLLTLFRGETAADAMIRFDPETGGRFAGSLEQINGLLAAMGYAPVAVRRNLMSHAAYLEAKDTPSYCSPASESYWSIK